MVSIDLGKSGLSASAVGLGCMRISPLGVRQTARLIDAAMEAGITLFDHADIYGSGACEELFGKVLRETPSLRDSMVLQSKCGIREGGYDLSKEYIVRSADAILKRLACSHLDILLLHRPDTLMEPEEIAEAFEQLHGAGKVLRFGVSNMNPAQIDLIRSATRFPLIVNQVQFSAAFTGLVDSGLNANVPNPAGSSRDGSLLEYCRLRGVTLQAWSPLQYGFFEGSFLGSPKYPGLNETLEKLGRKYARSPAAVAVAWILRHPARMQVLTGSTDIGHVVQAAQAADIALEREEWYEIYRSAGNVLP